MWVYCVLSDSNEKDHQRDILIYMKPCLEMMAHSYALFQLVANMYGFDAIFVQSPRLSASQKYVW